MRQGEDAHSVKDQKLSRTDVEEIVLASAQGTSQREIAERFGVSQPRISQILSTLRPLESKQTVELVEEDLHDALVGAPEAVLRSIMEDKSAPAMARVSAARVVSELAGKREKLVAKPEILRWADAFFRNSDREERAVLKRVVERMLAESDARTGTTA